MSQSSFYQLTEGGWTHDQDEVVDDVDASNDDQEDQPEPDEDIDLFIDDIYGQHAEGVVGLDGSRRSIFLVQAFGHPWKHSAHGIDPVLRVVFNKIDHFHPIFAEFSTKKHVNEENIEQHIEEC